MRPPHILRGYSAVCSRDSLGKEIQPFHTTTPRTRWWTRPNGSGATSGTTGQASATAVASFAIWGTRDAGSHTELIRMSYKDFARLAKPVIVRLTFSDTVLS